MTLNVFDPRSTRWFTWYVGLGKWKEGNAHEVS